jgi:hypothetical protein
MAGFYCMRYALHLAAAAAGAVGCGMLMPALRALSLIHFVHR